MGRRASSFGIYTACFLVVLGAETLVRVYLLGVLLEIYDKTGSLIFCEFGNRLWIGKRGVAGVAGGPAGNRRARKCHGVDHLWPGPGRGIAAAIGGLARGWGDGGAIL